MGASDILTPQPSDQMPDAHLTSLTGHHTWTTVPHARCLDQHQHPGLTAPARLPAEPASPVLACLMPDEDAALLGWTKGRRRTGAPTLDHSLTLSLNAPMTIMFLHNRFPGSLHNQALVRGRV